ncbi:MAG: amidinotransferase [Thermomicrobiales bacterium]|nr:amidinotransferase [Thermomicrobiales bacterium]
MSSLMTEPTVTTERAWGGQSMVAPLKRVLVRRPAAPVAEGHFADFGYPRAVDHDRTEREHDAFRALLAEAGAEVVVVGPDETGLLDAIFAYDPSLMTDAGAVLLRPGKELRLAEVDLAERSFAELGIPVIGRIEAPGTVEGGDTLWLDERTLAVGRGYRTNDEGIGQLKTLLAPHGVDIMTVDLPHWRGPGECLHLMSFISPVAERLAVVYLPLMSVPFVQELQHRGWSFIEVPDEEFETHGCNVLALAPMRVLVCDGSPVTRARLEAAGCAVMVYTGEELSHNRAGGPTCLTRPILRAADTTAGDSIAS